MPRIEERIEALSRRCSPRAFHAVDRLFDLVGRDAGALYRYITRKDFHCQQLRYVGPVTCPEVEQWCENVKKLVKKYGYF